MVNYISPKVFEKLTQRHGVSDEEIQECFANRTGRYVEDTRPEHKSDRPVWWFVAETNRGRKIKVVFIKLPQNDIEIKSAYEPSPAAEAFYKKKCGAPNP